MLEVCVWCIVYGVCGVVFVHTLTFFMWSVGGACWCYVLALAKYAYVRYYLPAREVVGRVGSSFHGVDHIWRGFLYTCPKGEYAA